MLAHARKHLEQTVDEPLDRVRGPLFQDAEVDEEPDAGLVAPVVRTAEDLFLDDPKIGSEGRFVADGLALGPLPVRSGPCLAT
jgi:hypothetical protein